MKSNLKTTRIVPPDPTVPFPDLFYWVWFSQSFVSEGKYTDYQKERRPFGFASYDAFGSKLDPDDCSYLCDPDDFSYKLTRKRKTCCKDFIDVGVEPGIDFEVCLFQELPWIFNLSASGGICHQKVVRKLQSAGFRGIESVENLNSSGDPDSAKYCALTTRSYVTQVVQKVSDEHENFCPNCGFQPVICSRCERRRCRDCFWGNNSIAKFSENVMAADYMPVQLASWNGDDVVSGEVETIITGRLLDFMIRERLTPFGYGPLAVDAHGASSSQLEFAEQARQHVELRFETK